MKRLKIIIMTILAACMFTACSSSDDNEGDNNSANLYAIIKPEGAQLIDIVPSDYVLTLDNIIAVNPETGEFKVKDTERIDSKAFPIPTQYVILFYSNGSFLFDAKLNSSISSYLPQGLTFCHFLSTDQQKQGMQRMYQILQKAGKIRSNIDYDFQFK